MIETPASSSDASPGGQPDGSPLGDGSPLADSASPPDAPQPSWAVVFTTTDLPYELAAGFTYKATLGIRNDSSNALVAGADYIAAGGNASTFLGGARVDLPSTVQPGQTVLIHFDLTAPAARSDYPTTWQVVSTASTPLSAQINQTISVPRPRYIEFGVDTPNTRSQANAVDVSRPPFDGEVIQPIMGGPFLRSEVMKNSPLPSDLLTRNDVNSDIAAFAGFSNNFLRVDAGYLNVAWNGDWTTVLGNIDLIGQLVAAHQLRGIVIDTEIQVPENSDVWDPTQASAADVRARGHDLAAHYSAAAPHTTILFTLAYSWIALQHTAGNTTFDRLTNFLDGMMEGAAESIRFVDGYEASYGYRLRNGSWDPKNFPQAHDEIRAARSLSAVPTLYDRRFEVGFGIWIDNKDIWDPNNFANNWFTPTEFGDSLSAARQASDGWVWVWSETVTWYSATYIFQQNPVPDAYRTALINSRN
jgi:hypothetical protein